jgi:hypothetical protein
MAKTLKNILLLFLTILPFFIIYLFMFNCYSINLELVIIIFDYLINDLIEYPNFFIIWNLEIM